jgi:hypothetical protein
MRNAAGQPQGAATFGSVADWATGFVTQICIHPTTGRMLIGCDNGNGVYMRDPGDTRWTQLLTTDRMAVGEYPNSPGYVSPTAPNNAGSNNWAGYGVEIARTNPDRFYIATNARLYRSDNGGQTLIRTAYPDTHMVAGEGNGRLHNSKMAVDTQNPDVVVIGTHDNGLRVSTNAGTSWTTVAAGTNTTVDTSISVKYAQLVACDPTGPVSGGIKQRWYAVCQGVGVYQSTAGPAGTYTQMTGGPTTAQCMVCDQNGNIWVASIDGTLWKFTAGGAWASVPNLGVACSDVAVDPHDANRVVVLDLQASALLTTNGGTSWQGGAYFRRYPIALGTVNRYATTVPSLNYGRGGLVFPGMIAFDPIVPNKLWLAEGTGVMWCNPPTGFGTADIPANRWDWYEISEGIKELVAEQVCVPPGGNPVFTYWDKPTYPTQDKTDPGLPIRSLPAVITSPGDVQHGWDVAYAADNPQWLAINCNWGAERSSYSTDGGRTWTLFPTPPSNFVVGGCIAVGNSGNVMIFRANNGLPVYTKNGGNSWAVLPFPGLPAQGVENGFSWAYYINRKIATYDIPGAAFYIYNYGVPGNTAATVGVWKSVDQGDTWTRVYAAKISGSDGGQVRFKAVPGQQDHLFFTCGTSVNAPIRRSTNGGVTWTDVPNTALVDDIGFGKPAPGKTYPTVFINGKVSGVYGIWRSDDSCASWVKIGDFPDGNFDPISCIAGDPDIYGRVYVGMHASGFYYGDYNFPMQLKP